MNEKRQQDLKNRILKEMTVDHSDALERNFEFAKRFVRITKGGKIHVLVKDRIPEKQSILLYLLGKLYAKEAGMVDSEAVKNKEIMDELGMIEGSVSGRLTELRDQGRVVRVKTGYHVIPLNQVEKTLREVEANLEQGE